MEEFGNIKYKANLKDIKSNMIIKKNIFIFT